MKFTTQLALVASASFLALASPALAQSAPAAETKPESGDASTRDGPQLGTFGFDTSGMDRSVAPGDDFYAFANGEWAKKTAIPADKSNYGMFTALDDLSKE